ncbi:hypothetical protein ABOZ94_001126 [Salmonella enterica]|nr:hypothetical protein [Salmonella enterica]EKZ7691940.1 hypothetical protein [Salmonella enterica]
MTDDAQRSAYAPEQKKRIPARKNKRREGNFTLHNSAQFCTIFLTDFLPFPACTGAV